LLSQAPASLKLRYESGCWRFSLQAGSVRYPKHTCNEDRCVTPNTPATKIVALPQTHLQRRLLRYLNNCY